MWGLTTTNTDFLHIPLASERKSIACMCVQLGSQTAVGEGLHACCFALESQMNTCMQRENKGDRDTQREQEREGK